MTRECPRTQTLPRIKVAVLEGLKMIESFPFARLSDYSTMFVNSVSMFINGNVSLKIYLIILRRLTEIELNSL